MQTNGPSKRRKARKDDDDDDDSAPPADADAVRIELNAHVSLTFSLKYLVNFAKSASLSNVVQLMMSNDVPLLVRPTALAASICGRSNILPLFHMIYVSSL